MEIRQGNNEPLHLLPVFQDRWPELRNAKLPNSENFYDTSLSMPTFTFEPYDIIDEYIAAFTKVCTFFAKNEASLINDLGDADVDPNRTHQLFPFKLGSQR